MVKPQQILKKAREAKGLTQEALAAEVGLSHRMMQRYEEGQFPKYKSEKVQAIDTVLGTKLYDIIYAGNVPREMESVVRDQPPGQEAGHSDYTDEYIESLKDQVRQARAMVKEKAIENIPGRLNGIEATLTSVLSVLKKQTDWMDQWMAGPAAPTLNHTSPAGKAKGNTPAVAQRVYSGKGSRSKKSSSNKR